LGGSAEWVNALNRLSGKIYLISGNHDIKNLRQNYTKYFEQIAMQMYIEVDKQKIYLNH
jgi:calcineurin-like phosphoesterase family protein